MEISSAVNKTSHAERTPRGVVIDRSMKLEPIIDHATHNPNTAPWSGHALGMVFDLLTDPKDLVACACVCKSWCAEIASSDHLFKAAWTREISEQGLWRWYRAAGGYREQLRADSVVRKGDCVASVFPINRGDGKILEVLLLDAKPEPRICTMHYRPPPAHCIRLTGCTVKVWSSATLCNAKNRPLCTIHDVVKHRQLEDGRLFLWRIQEGAIIRVSSTAGDQEEEEKEARHWTENTNLIASILDPITLELVDLPLDSTYGQGRCPFTFINCGIPGVLVIAGANLLENYIKIRLMDLKTGQCFRESSVTVPNMGYVIDFLNPEAVHMLLSHGGQIIAGAALYDCRVFKWKLKDKWMDPKTWYAEHENDTKLTTPPAVAPTEAGTGAVAVDDYNTAADTTLIEDGIEDIDTRNIPYGSRNCIKTAPAAQFSLHHIFTTVESEPITDLSMSTSAKRIYVTGLEYFYILADDGTLQFTLTMNQWRGVGEARRRIGYDRGCGASALPIPNSTRAVFHLTLTNALYFANFKNPEVDFWHDSSSTMYSRELGEYAPHRDRILSFLDNSTEPDPAIFPLPPAWIYRTLMHVESHTDLLPKIKALYKSSMSREMFPTNAEQVIRKCIQSGKTIFISGDSSCPGTMALLKKEKEAGTYLYGLGPNSVKNGKEKTTGPFVSRPGGDGSRGRGSCDDKRRKKRRKQENKDGNDGILASRAIICTDTETGRRYKTIPIEGIIESVHCAGHLLVVAVAPIDTYPGGAEGSLVVIDFSKEGFGVTDAQQQRQVQQKKGSGKIHVGGEVGVDGQKSVESGDHQNTAGEAGPSKAKRSRRSGK